MNSVTDTLALFGRTRAEDVLAIAKAGEPDGIHGSLVLAVFSVETDYRNILGDRDSKTGHFHARGVGQINDRFWQTWLDSVLGCQAGSWHVEYPSAGATDRVPGLRDTTHKTIAILQAWRVDALKAGIPDVDVIRVAVAGYNCGSYYAIRGYRDGNVDQHTTGACYSKKVLERQAIIRRFLREHSWKPQAGL